MRILVTGATGYIGTAVTEKLQAAGHTVAGLARSDVAAEKLSRLGAEVVRGDLRDAAAVSKGARLADAVIHLAMEMSAEAPALDRAAVEAILEGLDSSGRPFVYTSGIWVLGSTGGHVADENTPLNPVPLVAWRPAHEQMVRRAAGVSGVVIRPGMVYGRNGGFAAMFGAEARETGVAHYVGTGENRWPLVDVDDLADLYVLALGAPAGSVYFAVAGPSIPVKEVAQAAAGGRPVEGIPLETARQSMGALADALTLDQMVSGHKAVAELGWAPQAKNVLQRLAGD